MKKIFCKILYTLIILSGMQLNSWAKEAVNIVYAIDNNYPFYTTLSINSVLKNNKSNSDIHFYIIETNVSDKNKKMMSDFVTKRHQKIKFIHWDENQFDVVKNIFKEKQNWWSSVIISRYTTADLLPEEHRALYIDGDTLVVKDIKDLYNQNLGNHSTGMIKDVDGDYRRALHNLNHTYYNSGVVLMDLDKWRQRKIFNKMMTYLTKNEQRFGNGKEFEFIDQDLANVSIADEIKELPQLWDYQTNGYLSVKIDDLDDVGLIHYVTRRKPWTHPNYKKSSKAYKWYHQYWSKTDFKIEQHLVIIKFLVNDFKDAFVNVERTDSPNLRKYNTLTNKVSLNINDSKMFFKTMKLSWKMFGVRNIIP